MEIKISDDSIHLELKVTQPFYKFKLIKSWFDKAFDELTALLENAPMPGLTEDKASVNVIDDVEEDSDFPVTAEITEVIPIVTEYPGEVVQDIPRVDSRGIEWDERIHSNTKLQKKDGTWRPKNGLNKKYVKTIEKEIKSTEGIFDQASPAPAPVQVAPPPPPSSAAKDITVGEVITKILEVTKSGKISTVEIIELQKNLGIKNLGELVEQPSLAKDFLAMLNAL